VYEELRRLAQKKMALERDGHILQATARVNEAFIRLVEIDQIQWRNRTHLFCCRGTSDATDFGGACAGACIP
jgi:hypothetical protein